MTCPGVDWLTRILIPEWLTFAGLGEEAAALRALPPLSGPAAQRAARPAVRAVRDAADAAWRHRQRAALYELHGLSGRFPGPGLVSAGMYAWATTRTGARESVRDSLRDLLQAVWDGDADGSRVTVITWAAAWAATWAAAGLAARTAGGDSAWRVAGDAAVDLAWPVAGDAAWAGTWDVAWQSTQPVMAAADMWDSPADVWDTAWHAAWVTASARLVPQVTTVCLLEAAWLAREEET